MRFNPFQNADDYKEDWQRRRQDDYYPEESFDLQQYYPETQPGLVEDSALESNIEIKTKETDMRPQNSAAVTAGMLFADDLISRGYLSNLDEYTVLKPQKSPKFEEQMEIFHITRLIYEEGEDVNEKLVSVYGALHNVLARVFLILKADSLGVNFYIGTAVEENTNNVSLAGDVLKNGIQGNFPGSLRKDDRKAKLSKTDIQDLMENVFAKEKEGAERAFSSNKNASASIASVTMIPSERGTDRETFVQGLEKLIDAMQGKVYTAMFLAVPLTHDVIDARKSGLEYLYSILSPLSKKTFAYGENVSKAVSEGINSSFSNSVNTSVTDSNSENFSSSRSITDTKGTTDGTTTGISRGDSENVSTPLDEGGSVSAGSNSGVSFSTSHTKSKSRSKTESITFGESFSHSVTNGSSQTITNGRSENFTNTLGENRTFTINYENKSITGMMDHIEEHLKRIKICESFGLWDCSAYFIAEDSVAMTAASMYHSLMTGETSQIEKSFVNFWNYSTEREKIHSIKTYLMQGYHPLMELPATREKDNIASQLVSPAAMVSGKELPLLLSFPRASVPGIMVDNIASFGRSIILAGERPEREIELGCVMHKGEISPEYKVTLDLDLLTSHCFITGSTGSGKSNTTAQLISQFYKKEIPFLVIEPAKGEYKVDFGNMPDINVFWTNPNDYQMLHLNPFRFPQELHVLEHLDRLIEMFSACWPLTAAMPSILKDTMERAYEACGWDMAKSICLHPDGVKYPNFNTVQQQLEKVINESNYSAESKGDYKGALGTRIRALTRGIMGQVFCAENDIQDETLFDKNTIVDLSRVGSSETKALLMGILVMKLNEYRSAKATADTQNSGLRHITILEEAHNLLRRNSPGSGSDVQTKSIEMISNSIAEMRTYGEGFLIVDQSPTAVDISAIKNTNTKIVMRLPEESDFTTIGGAFSLEKAQIREIPRLGKGEAIVSQSGWLQPILTKVNSAKQETKKWKYKKQETDPQRVRQAKGRICTMLRKRIEDGRCGSADSDLTEFRAILENSTLTPFKQKEELEKIRSCLDMFKPQQCENWSRLGETVIRILDCNGLFRTLPLKFEDPDGQVFTDSDKKRYYTWQKRFQRSMDLYAQFETEEDKMEAFRFMQLYKMETARHFRKLNKYKEMIQGEITNERG